jgi:ATP-dependent helicase HrpB
VERTLQQLSYGLRSFAELRAACGDGGLERAMGNHVPTNIVNELAPTHVTLPSGRRAKIEYAEQQTPWVASRLQDFFGMRDTPRIAGGRVPVVVHLLAPNGRPVQMTQDLSSFWKNLYAEVRRELSRRYPRHRWPENPLEATPTSAQLR